MRAYANRGAQYDLTTCRRWSSSSRPACCAGVCCPLALPPFLLNPSPFPPLHPHPDQHQHHIGQAHPDPASLHVHARTDHPGQKGEGIVHHDDAGCLVFGAAVQGCMSKVKRQPAGSPDALAECGRSVDRMPHEPGSPELHTVCSCRDRLCRIWEAARHSSRLPPSGEEHQQWAPAICRDGTRTHGRPQYIGPEMVLW